jgi:hypothetical protein
MVRVRTTATVEADLVALRAAAERAGSALACLFSSSDEYEAEIIRVRRAAGAFKPQHRGRLRAQRSFLIIALTLALLLL